MPRKKSPQVEQAYQYIKNKILKYEILPGEVISDNALAAELGMSRSPIREAIMRLETVGLVERVAHGVICARLGKDDIEEICELRRALEVLAVELIFKKGGLNKKQTAELTDIYNSFTRAFSGEKRYYWDDMFHATIVAFSNNKRLISMLEQMQLQISRVRWLNILAPRAQASFEEHEQIYRALLAKDEQGCIDAVRLHLVRTEENFLRILEDPQYRMVQLGVATLFTN